MREFPAIIKIVEKISKSGNPFLVAEIYIDGKIVKDDVYLSAAEKTLFEILG